MGVRAAERGRVAARPAARRAPQAARGAHVARRCQAAHVRAARARTARRRRVRADHCVRGGAAQGRHHGPHRELPADEARHAAQDDAARGVRDVHQAGRQARLPAKADRRQGDARQAGHHRDAGSDARGAGAVPDGPQDGAANLHGGGRHRRQDSARPARKDAQGAARRGDRRGAARRRHLKDALPAVPRDHLLDEHAWLPGGRDPTRRRRRRELPRRASAQEDHHRGARRGGGAAVRARAAGPAAVLPQEPAPAAHRPRGVRCLFDARLHPHLAAAHLLGRDEQHLAPHDRPLARVPRRLPPLPPRGVGGGQPRGRLPHRPRQPDSHPRAARASTGAAAGRAATRLRPAAAARPRRRWVVGVAASASHVVKPAPPSQRLVGSVLCRRVLVSAHARPRRARRPSAPPLVKPASVTPGPRCNPRAPFDASSPLRGLSSLVALHFLVVEPSLLSRCLSFPHSSRSSPPGTRRAAGTRTSLSPRSPRQTPPPPHPQVR
mmetsp:Transcript_252/g.859  ORF Transcript_252/g.859 Transcript_252/m.859 type:complete len:495 (-) Transcript_252:36-1520(-)